MKVCDGRLGRVRDGERERLVLSVVWAAVGWLLGKWCEKRKASGTYMGVVEISMNGHESIVEMINEKSNTVSEYNSSSVHNLQYLATFGF